MQNVKVVLRLSHGYCWAYIWYFAAPHFKSCIVNIGACMGLWRSSTIKSSHAFFKNRPFQSVFPKLYQLFTFYNLKNQNISYCQSYRESPHSSFEQQAKLYIQEGYECQRRCPCHMLLKPNSFSERNEKYVQKLLKIHKNRNFWSSTKIGKFLPNLPKY